VVGTDSTPSLTKSLRRRLKGKTDHGKPGPPLTHRLFLGGGLLQGLIWDGVESVPTTLTRT